MGEPQQAEPEEEQPAPARPRLSALDSEVLRVDDRILGLERTIEKQSKDLYVMRDILIDQILTVALVELAIGVIVVVLALAYWHEKEGRP